MSVGACCALCVLSGRLRRLCVCKGQAGVASFREIVSKKGWCSWHSGMMWHC